MTREEAIRKHREMWRWIVEKPWKTKAHYLKMFDPEANLENDCYLCEYVKEHYDDDCTHCPLEWPGGHCRVYQSSSKHLKCGLYGKWLDAIENAINYDDFLRAAPIARQIAELPEKDI